MSIRLQDISTSTAVDSDDKVLVTDGSTEFLTTLESVYNAIKGLLPLVTFSISGIGSRDVQIAPNTAGVIFTAGAGASKAMCIFNANGSAAVTRTVTTEETNPFVTFTSGTGTLTISVTSAYVVKCCVIYWYGTVTV